jgi:hypothetical protein
MTGPDNQSTRPISVAELLAKNGTIGSPPVGGGRRRRRRGNSDAVTVAELTGEIPIFRDEDDDAAVAEEVREADEDHSSNGAAMATVVAPVSKPAEPEIAEPARPPEPEAPRQREPEPPPRSSEPRPRREAGPERSHDPRPMRRTGSSGPGRGPRREPPYARSGAEQMSPDLGDEHSAAVLDVAGSDSRTAVAEADDTSFLQSYLRSSNGPLFSGQTVADDLARRGAHPDDVDEEESLDILEPEDKVLDEQQPKETKATALLRGAWIVVQSILAVAFGAGLFIAFDQLWKWNNIVALVLSVLVILGLVVGVRVVRKTEDIASTLIAVAVGALVTLGPLALLQSN